ncbi:MAG: hypothetical protein IT373_36990 [Polyangiaceae bacterium]|nr:hypothetical protein [Polyangiaceae bacterium]
MSQRSVIRGLALLALGGTLFAAAGCATSTDGDEPTGAVTAAVEGATAASPKERPRRGAAPNRPGRPEGREPGMGPGGGPLAMLRGALADLGLSDAQRQTVADAFAAVRDVDAERPGAAVHEALVAQVRAGKIDRAALEALATGSEGFAAKRAALVQAVTVLHDTLTPAERTALVATLEQRFAEHGACGERAGARGPEARGGDRPDKAPADARHGRPGGPDARGRDPLGRLLRGLDLPEQRRARIEAALEAADLGAGDKPEPGARCEEHKAELQALAKAFVADDFDADKALPAAGPAGPMAAHGERLVALEVVVPLLDATERGALADALEQRGGQGRPGERSGHRKGGMRGPEVDHRGPRPPADR